MNGNKTLEGGMNHQHIAPVSWLIFTFILMHGSCYLTVRLLNKLFNAHRKSVESQGPFLRLIIVHDLQVYLANLALTSQIPNVFRTFKYFTF